MLSLLEQRGILMISIGKMSLACHVSIKTLRYYDRIGLLTPALTDENTGYRYYRTDQIETMVLISRYKRYGFSLGEIHLLLHSARQQKQEMMRKQQHLLEGQLQEMQMTLQDLRVTCERLERNDEMETTETYAVDLIHTASQPVFSKRDTMGVGDFGKAYGELFEEMFSKGIRPAGLTGSRYWDQEFDPAQSDIEVFVCTDNTSLANAEIGGTLCARTLHKGGYSALTDAYSALMKWVEENGYVLIGAPYELYTKNGFDHLPPSEWITEIYFPIQKKED